MSETLSWRKDGTVAHLVMSGGANVHNPGYMQGMLGLLDQIEADPEIRAVLIESTDAKNWSQGMDLEFIMGAMPTPEGQVQMKAFLYDVDRLFVRLLTFPVPVIAALNGHAFGNGANVACACDFRFMRADRGFFCFPEVDVSIPLTPGMQAIVEKVFPAPLFNDMYLTGRRVGAAELERWGVVQRACADLAELEAASLEFARGLQKNRGIFAAIKARKHRHVLAIIEREDPPVFESLKLFA
jgi:enoyl-CoA hydratase/carnithine racemase